MRLWKDDVTIYHDWLDFEWSVVVLSNENIQSFLDSET